MGQERTEAQIDLQAEQLLVELEVMASVLKEGEKITVFPEERNEAESTTGTDACDSVFYTLFLTPEGLVEKRQVATYRGDLSETGGIPEKEGGREYPANPDSTLVKHYDIDEDHLKRLEKILLGLQ
jgi:intein/homing endonuclease